MKRTVLAVGFVLALVPACGPDAPKVTTSRLRTAGCGLADEIATGFSAGSGVVITTAHPLAGDAPVLRDGGSGDLAITALDMRADVALLSSGSRRGDLPQFRAAEVGENVTVMLIRDGKGQPTEAMVRKVAPIRFHDAVAGTVVERDGLVLSIGIVGGDSGAPVLGRDGKVLGMMFANAKESTESYAVASSEIQNVLAAPTVPVERPPC